MSLREGLLTTTATLPPDLQEVVAQQPPNVDRRTGAALITRYLFPVSQGVHGHLRVGIDGSGTAKVTLDGTVTEVRAGESIDIPLEGAHRVANVGDTDVVLIEVQHGSYFGEDDIVRLEDDFGRVPEA